nr:tripartite tricarboxylate transporter substrate-binding protein [Cupriavidus basilensis]
MPLGEGGDGRRALRQPGHAPAITDLMGGQVSMMFDTTSSALPYIKAGKLRLLVVATAKRSSALPDVPTLAEAGLPGFDVASWFGVMAPAGTPPEIVAKLSAEIARSLARDDVKQQFAAIGAEPVGNTSAQMRSQIQQEIGRFGKLVKQANLSMD